MENQEREMTFEEIVLDLRKRIKHIAQDIKTLKKEHAETPNGEKEDRGEVMAQMTLAYRHLEDASMRLGKVLQYRNDGVSVYDGKVDDSVVGSPEGTPADPSTGQPIEEEKPVE